MVEAVVVAARESSAPLREWFDVPVGTNAEDDGSCWKHSCRSSLICRVQTSVLGVVRKKDEVVLVWRRGEATPKETEEEWQTGIECCGGDDVGGGGCLPQIWGKIWRRSRYLGRRWQPGVMMICLVKKAVRVPYAAGKVAGQSG